MTWKLMKDNSENMGCPQSVNELCLCIVYFKAAQRSVVYL